MIFPALKIYSVSSLADEIDPSDVEAMLPAILVGNYDPNNGYIDFGVLTHLWRFQASMNGRALCGAFPRGIYTQWRVSENAEVTCFHCLSLKAEVLSVSPHAKFIEL